VVHANTTEFHLTKLINSYMG